MNPDGDAIGSTLGLKHLLEPLGHEVQVVVPTPKPNYMNWAPGFNTIWDAFQNEKEVLNAIAEADAIFCMDFGVLSRAKSLEEPIAQAAGFKVNIDHHMDYEPFAQYEIRDIAASSTCELVYRMARLLPQKPHINADCANCLYAGISTDTGSFRHRNASAHTLRIAADLIEAGADVEFVNYGLYSCQTENRLRLTGFCLLERLKVLEQFKTAYISINAKEYEQFNIQPGDTEGLVNLALSVDGVNLGVLLVERPDSVRLSFRSMGKFPANQLAAHFNGGGHYNAAGGRSQESIETTEIKLLNLLQQYESQLNYKPFEIHSS